AFEVFGKLNASASLCPPSRPGERLPSPEAVPERAQEEDLPTTPLFVAAVEPRHPHPDIVAHEDIPVPQQFRKVGEPKVRDGRRLPVKREEPARAARPRRLGDPVPRKEIV